MKEGKEMLVMGSVLSLYTRSSQLERTSGSCISWSAELRKRVMSWGLPTLVPTVLVYSTVPCNLKVSYCGNSMIRKLTYTLSAPSHGIPGLW